LQVDDVYELLLNLEHRTISTSVRNMTYESC